MSPRIIITVFCTHTPADAKRAHAHSAPPGISIKPMAKQYWNHQHSRVCDRDHEYSVYQSVRILVLSLRSRFTPWRYHVYSIKLIERT